jgi:hypothetical protein
MSYQNDDDQQDLDDRDDPDPADMDDDDATDTELEDSLPPRKPLWIIIAAVITLILILVLWVIYGL